MTGLPGQALGGEARNPRRAGRKPKGLVKTHQKVTVYLEDFEAYSQVKNKAEFVRSAIKEKIERDRL